MLTELRRFCYNISHEGKSIPGEDVKRDVPILEYKANDSRIGISTKRKGLGGLFQKPYRKFPLYCIVCFYNALYSWYSRLSYRLFVKLAEVRRRTFSSDLLPNPPRNSLIDSQQLESVNNNSSAPVLSSDIQSFDRNQGLVPSPLPTISGGSNGTTDGQIKNSTRDSRDEAATSLGGRERNGITTSSQKPRKDGVKRRSMPVFTLNGYHSKTIPYDLPLGIERKKIAYHVEAQFEVLVYFMDDAGLANYDANQPFVNYSAVRRSPVHREEIQLPRGGRWYLVVVNPFPSETPVFCEILL
jgi:hypothetical protein